MLDWTAIFCLKEDYMTNDNKMTFSVYVKIAKQFATGEHKL